MLTDSQVQVLSAINDHMEIHGRLTLDHERSELPPLLAELDIPDVEVYQATGDLMELGFIDGVKSFGRHYPTRVLRVTALGRAELP